MSADCSKPPGKFNAICGTTEPPRNRSQLLKEHRTRSASGPYVTRPGLCARLLLGSRIAKSAGLRVRQSAAPAIDQALCNPTPEIRSFSPH